MFSQIKFDMKMRRKGHKTQKKCVKLSKLRLKEVIFKFVRSKVRILRRLWKNLRLYDNMSDHAVILQPHTHWTLCKLSLIPNTPETVYSLKQVLISFDFFSTYEFSISILFWSPNNLFCGHIQLFSSLQL